MDNANNDKAKTGLPDFDCADQMTTVYGPQIDYLNRAVVIYERAKNEFLSLNMGDSRVLDYADRWREYSVSLMRQACGYFGKQGSTEDDRKTALDIMDKVTKDSAVRSTNVSNYYDILAGKFPEKTDWLMIAEKADMLHINTVDRMARTQLLYLKRDMETDGLTHLQRIEKKASVRAHETYKRIPEGHVYRPFAPYPPERIPADQPVPDWPEPLNRWDAVPMEDKVFDKTMNEFVPRPGYISEDGLIDDKTVIFHPETNEVEFGYRGGPRYRWKYWKPKNDRDIPDPDSWYVEYYRRFYKQFMLRPAYEILSPTMEEMAQEFEYNKIPERRE